MGDRSWRRKIIFTRWPWRYRLIAVAVGSFSLAVLLVPLPSPLFNQPLATTLHARNGQLLSAAIAADQQWRFPPADSVPFKFATAVRLYEDEYFYYHPGINPVALARAVQQNSKAGKIVSGGSTISMQTMRMAYGNRPRTYGQKLIETLAALKLELLHSKTWILRAYANNAPFGGNIVGLRAAAYRYYGQPPHRLSWAEAAALAVLPNNPAAVFPGKNTATFRSKRNRLLDKLHTRGFLNKDDLFLAKQEPLPQALLPLPNDAYHLLHRSMQEGGQGKHVQTTLDARLQKKVAGTVNRHSAAWSGNQVHNAAALVVETTSGNILAYVGNSANRGENGQYVDIITARRSPGSLLKPFLYAAALDEGLILPRQLLPDIPLFYRGFAPQNFDRKYRGAVPADQALISSLNVPFVHLLIAYGYEKFHHKLQQLGMHSLDQPASHYGLSLILGGAETTLDELTAVYAGIARASQRHPQRLPKAGYPANDYFDNRYRPTSPLPEAPAATGYLQAPSIGFTLRAMQQLNRPDQEAGWQQFTSATPIAWKTGTSFGLRDGWAIGITTNYVVGVWVGNADGEGRPGLTGLQAAAPLLFKIFDLLPGEAEFAEPFGQPTDVCRQSGMRAGENCPATTSIALPEYLAGTRSCSYHQLIHLNKAGNRQVNSNCYAINDIQTVAWFVLPPVMSWYYQKYHPRYRKLPPFASGCNTMAKGRLFGLIYPRQFTRVYIPAEQDGQRGKVVFEAAHENKQAILYWHLDDKFLGMTEGTHQMGIQAAKGLHTLTLVDNQGHELEQRFAVIN